MAKFAGEEGSNPKSLRELIQKKFLDEVVGIAGKFLFMIIFHLYNLLHSWMEGFGHG